MSTVSCAYCGEETDKPTRDHVVPSTLWGGRGFRPKHPVIVPACGACQLAFDSDAEYFRNCLVMVMDRNSHPVAERLLTGPVIRSLERSQRAVADVTRGQRRAYKMTASGLIIGEGLSFQIDLSRTHRVVEKIIRGIYYHKEKHRFPTDHEVRVFPGNRFWQDEGCRNLIESMNPYEHQGDDVFACRYVLDNSGHDMTAWLISFYSQVAFFAWTQRCALPSDRGDRATSEPRSILVPPISEEITTHD